jgi:uncharacterized protein VirK/YbjX
MKRAAAARVPGKWEAFRWALEPGAEGGGTSRARLAWRALRATLWHGKTLRRWMLVVFELHSREILPDLPGEYLRAIRPSVRGDTGFGERVVQLIEHADWLETAFQPAAFAQFVSGEPVVLAELAPPRGYDFMRLQLEQASPQSTEGEILLTLSLRRSADVQHKPQPVEVGVLCFSRFRVAGVGCLVVGGVRGQRNSVQRISVTEISQALQGWQPAVLLVSVAQELARHWGLSLIGLDPAAHRLHGWSYRWNKRYRAAGERIFASYEALWAHFDAKPGPAGWVIMPLDSDEKLAATALSPEKRARQTRRADYWIRTRNLLRAQFKQVLQRPHREPSLTRVTQSLERDSVAEPDTTDFQQSEPQVPERVLQTGPGTLY